MTGAPRQRAPLMKSSEFAIGYMNNRDHIQQYNQRHYHCSLMCGIMWQMNISSPGQSVHRSLPRMPHGHYKKKIRNVLFAEVFSVFPWLDGTFTLNMLSLIMIL